MGEDKEEKKVNPRAENSAQSSPANNSNQTNKFDIQFAETEDIGKPKNSNVTPPGKINKIKIDKINKMVNLCFSQKAKHLAMKTALIFHW